MRPSRALAKQSLDSSTIWWWMKLRTPSASGRMFSGEKERMNSSSFPSICVVAWQRSRIGKNGGGGTWIRRDDKRQWIRFREQSNSGISQWCVTRGEETNLTFDSDAINALDFSAPMCQFLLLKLCKNNSWSLGWTLRVQTRFSFCLHRGTERTLKKLTRKCPNNVRWSHLLELNSSHCFSV